MPLLRRFTLRPDQIAAIEKTRAEKQTVPIEEPLAIETMVPADPPKEESAIITEEIPAKITEEKTEEPVEETAVETVDEKTEEPTEEKVEDPTEKKVEESVEEKEPVEEAAEEAKEEKAEEPAAEEVKKPRRTRKSTKKAETEASKDPEETKIVNVTNNLNKNQEVADACAVVIPVYTDTEFEDFKEQLEEDLKWTSFDEHADTGQIRIIVSHLSRCFDNVSRQYAKTNTRLEQLSNKTYGIIPRQIILNSNGSNEATRKQNGVHAPEVYKGTDGKTINLYALQGALEAESIYLQTIMRQLEFKRSTLISYLNAHKMETIAIGD